MANGFVTKKNGAYYVVLRIQVEDKRKEKWISVRKELGLDRPAKLAEANKLLRQKLEQVGELNALVVGNVTLKDYLEGWLEAKRLKVRKNTYLLYDSLLRTHVYPDDIATIKIEKLNLHVIQAFVNRLLAKGPSARLVKETHMILSQALKQAVQHDLIPKNPAAGVELPTRRRPEKKIWDDESAAKFIEYIKGQPLELFYLLAFQTGLRRGEILGLTWPCVDWNSNKLIIKYSLSIDRELVPPKTENSIREVKISQELMSALKKLQKAQKKKLFILSVRNEQQFVFLTSVGTPYRPDNVLRHLKETCRKLDLPSIDIHSLRHLHVSWLLDEGIDFKTIQDRVGHADIRTTLNIYACVK